MRYYHKPQMPHLLLYLDSVAVVLIEPVNGEVSVTGTIYIILKLSYGRGAEDLSHQNMRLAPKKVMAAPQPLYTCFREPR